MSPGDPGKAPGARELRTQVMNAYGRPYLRVSPSAFLLLDKEGTRHVSSPGASPVCTDIEFRSRLGAHGSALRRGAGLSYMGTYILNSR